MCDVQQSILMFRLHLTEKGHALPEQDQPKTAA